MEHSGIKQPVFTWSIPGFGVVIHCQSNSSAPLLNQLEQRWIRNGGVHDFRIAVVGRASDEGAGAHMCGIIQATLSLDYLTARDVQQQLSTRRLLLVSSPQRHAHRQMLVMCTTSGGEDCDHSEAQNEQHEKEDPRGVTLSEQNKGYLARQVAPFRKEKCRLSRG